MCMTIGDYRIIFLFLVLTREVIDQIVASDS